ncbi:insulin-like growth factor-binding protein 2 isoform X2 [Bubalus kerabau]|uniref:insulin-like growth factor-binding protein 2 isoform X2 n=1 Tax=Bubalus carabanensis TaxID=3119969 RepID=UPI00244EA07B|nr:insulin-like growth factor-binding protein 2 isoform X2 [Bubalus carabanensis]
MCCRIISDKISELLVEGRESMVTYLKTLIYIQDASCAGLRVWPAILDISADNGEEQSEGGLVENHVDGNVNLMGGGGGAGRKPLKSGMKELAVFREKVTEQHRQMGKGGKHHLGLEEPKKLRPPPARTPCQQELDQVLERISTMRLPDERGPLEHLYSLHIPNCDKHGLYNLKQCKMSLNGQRGECWCVNPNTGKLIQGAPTIRGDPECHLFYNEQQGARGVHTQRMQ